MYNNAKINELINMIRLETYYKHIHKIKSDEDMLYNIIKSNKSSYRKYENTNIIKITDDLEDLFEDKKPFIFDNFNLLVNDEYVQDIIMNGPYIRFNLLLNHPNAKLRNDIYVYRIKNEWEDIILNFDEYEEKENEYIYKYEDKTIILIKKKYECLNDVMFQNSNEEYLKRVIWNNGYYYVSNMFLIQFQTIRSKINEKINDPIMNTIYDPLNIYQQEKKKVSIHDIIDKININILYDMEKHHIENLYEDKTIIELFIDKYMTVDNKILLNSIEKIIYYLLRFEYIRHPYAYAYAAKLNEKNHKLFMDIFNNYKGDHDIKQTSLSDINDAIIEKYIKDDDYELFNNYVNYIGRKVSKIDIRKIIKYGSNKIILNMLNDEMIDRHTYYYMLLMSKNIKMLENYMDFEICKNYVVDLVINGLYEPFKLMIDIDETIIDIKYENNNLLHLVNEKGDYMEIIKLLLTKNINLCDEENDDGYTPLIYHAKNDNENIVNLLLLFNIDVTKTDINKNTCLHYICKNGNESLCHLILSNNNEIINCQNDEDKTPLIISSEEGNEIIVNLLLTYGANRLIIDKYGNTMYHYMCNNGICIGEKVPLIKNNFDLTPSDYCKIAKQYYNFYKK